MLGLDVSKATLAGTLVEARSRRVLWEQTVPNTADGVQHLLAASPPACPWVLEPTGSWSAPVARQAQAAGRQVLLAPPKQAKAFLAAVQARAKTDRLDSRGLALYALAVPLRPYPLKSAPVEHLDQLLAARTGLVRSLTSLRQQRAALPAAAGPLEGAIAAVEAQRKALDRQIAAHTRAHLPAAAALQRVPGIGPVTAAAVASCLTAKQFAHPDQFVAYVGMDVRVRDSGRRRGQRALTKQGHAELRRLLYVCAQASLRARHSPFKAQYERERAKGLATTAALCAVARKLARVCWSLHRHGTPFDATRVYQQPAPPARPEVTA